jgi:DsbC/DsbD-like thiol-disulfide interchange protein
MTDAKLKHQSPIFGSLFFLLLITLAILNRSVNTPMQTDWHENINSEMRVIMSEFKNDNLYIGFEINLSDNTYTYWSNPGDSGIEPDIKISTNNAINYEVLWPLPEMIKDQYGTNYGYYGNIVIPIKISLPDTRENIDLYLSYNLGVCNSICIPIDGKIKIPMLDSQDYYRKKSNRGIQEALKNTPFYRDDGTNFINTARLQQSNNSEIINLIFSKPIRRIYPMTSKKFFLSDIEDIKDSYINYNFLLTRKMKTEKISSESFSVVILNDVEFFIEDFIID